LEKYCSIIYAEEILGGQIVDSKKIQRINELAHKKKTVGLTEAEAQEQAELRKEYLEGIRANFRQTLESIEYKD
jgi:uncharacterized protein YnzC (UPF0291/DUF896 family)